MGLTITLPNDPSFCKDGIIVEVATTTTGVQAHFIVLEVLFATRLVATLKHPVINEKAIFDIGDILIRQDKELFRTYGKDILYASRNVTIWNVKAAEIYNFDMTYINITTSGFRRSYSGSGKSFSITQFLTPFKKKKIHRSDFVLLYHNSSSAAVTCRLRYNDPPIIDVTQNIHNSNCLILIDSSLHPSDATILIVEIINQSDMFEIEILDFPIIAKKTLIYKNSFGLYDVISLYAHEEMIHEYNFETIQTSQGQYKFNTTYIEKTNKATYPLGMLYEDEKEAAIILRELFLADEVYLVNDDFSYEPVMITDTSRKIYNTMDNLSFLEISYHKIEKNA